MGSAPMGARFVPVEGVEYDPDDYRKCTTCGAATGTLCASQSGRVAGGQPDGIRTLLPRPHVARQRRAGR